MIIVLVGEETGVQVKGTRGTTLEVDGQLV